MTKFGHPPANASYAEVRKFANKIDAEKNLSRRPMTIIMNTRMLNGKKGWVIRWGFPPRLPIDPAEFCGSKFDCDVCGHKCRAYEMDLAWLRAFAEQHPNLMK